MSPIYTPGKLVLRKDYIPLDANYSNVSLLLHGDGPNGSTIFTDNSPSPKTVTAAGNAQISTAQSKFGGSSIAFDGSGDRLTIPTSSAFEFGASDFTIELWLYRVGTGQQHLYEGRDNSVINRPLLYLNASTQLAYYANGAVVISTTAVPTPNDWSHIAICRGSGSSRLFLNGTQVGSTYSDSISYAAPGSVLIIGANDAYGTVLNGYIDELRITKGVARYTSNFAVPSEPFPNGVNG